MAFLKSGFLFGQPYTVMMANFAASANKVTDQPLCGINPVSITPAESAANVTITDTSFGVVRISISDAVWDSKCEVSLVEWNGIDRSALELRKWSTDCSAVVFSSIDVGYAYGYGTKYSFEIAEFSIADTSTETVNPRATSGTISQTILGDSCNASNMGLDRLDASSVGVSITGGKPYGACRVTLTRYDGIAMTMVRVGLCSSLFRFTSNNADILFADSKIVKFTYDYFPDGDVKIAAFCTSTEATFTIPQFQCAQSITMISQVGRYTFSIASPTPVTGPCKLLISNCTGSTQPPTELPFSSCTASLTLSFADLTSVVTDLVPGASCDFNWKYYGGSTLVCSATGSTVRPTIFVPLSVTQTSFAPDSITVSLAGIPAELSAYLTASGKMGKCFAWNAGCNGGVVASPTKVEIIGCSGSVTLTSDMTVNDNCAVEVALYASTDLNTMLGYSGPLSMAVSGVPEWGATQKPVVILYGDECLQLSWDAPASTGGSPVLCYETQRRDATGSFYVISDCMTGGTSRVVISCGFTHGVDYRFQVIAINRNGRSKDLTCVSKDQRVEFLQAAPQSEYLTPTASEKTFSSGSFPAIIVQENNPTTPLGGLDTSTTERLFVAVLVSRCKLDSTATVKLPLTVSDPDYTSAALPIPHNSPPAFTEVFDPVQGSAGVYRLLVISQPPAGAYSAITYSLESGGLGGYYFANPFFSGSQADVTRKDPRIDFNWGSGPIVNSTTKRTFDLVSVRWTGFIEAPYTETFTFFATANSDQVRVWIDDVFVINKWESSDLCNRICLGSIALRQSTSLGRQFSSIRIEFVHSKGKAQAKSAYFSLKWVSPSQALEILPVGRLFKALPIQSLAKPITISPGRISASACTFSLSSASFSTDKSSSMLIYARDSFGNMLQNSDSEFKVRFSGALGGSVDFTSVPVNASLSNGTYVIPFKIAIADVYTVTIIEMVSGSNISGSPFSLTVSGGVPYAIANPVADVGTLIAGNLVSFAFDVEDVSGNKIDGSTLDILPNVHVSAVWTSDSISQSRLPVDDVSWRSTRFGSIFTNATISWSSGKFRAGIRLPRAGEYSVEFSVDGGGPSITISPKVTIASSSVSFPTHAVVISTPFPPTDLPAGMAATFLVQLRDEYMNAISTAVTGSPTVMVQLQKHPTAHNQVGCSASSVAGVFNCTITPEVAGSNLAFSLLVDDVFVASIYDSAGSSIYARGPWYVNVTSSSVSGSNSLLSGVRQVYVAGVSADATLLLRDEFNNKIGAVNTWPTIAAVLTDGGSTTITMNPNTFRYDATSGIVTIPIVATQPDTGLTLLVTVDGDPVPLPYGISAGTISTIESYISADTTVCMPYSNGKAGSTFATYCLTKDSQSNAISWTDLLAYTTFVHSEDSSRPSVVAQAVVHGANPQQWDLSTSGLTKAGTWWYYTIVGQPGGLMAQYYALPSFSSLIGIGGTPLSNVLSGNVSPMLYTQIDQFLDFDMEGPFIVDDTTALSVTWSGRILSPVSGEDSAVTFRIACTGGVRVEIGAMELDLLSALSVDETFNMTMAEETFYPIQIDYLPGTTAALILNWTYPGAPISSKPFSVPPSALHAMLNVESTLKTLTVDLADVAVLSTASLPIGPIVGQPELIVIQATDIYGNEFTSLPACLSGIPGVSPACLFVASLAQDDGTVFGAPVDIADGTIGLPVTFATDGPKDVHIKLKTSGGLKDIQGSPYLISVNPAR